MCLLRFLWLLPALCLEFDHVFTMDNVANMDRPATDFAVFDVGLAANGRIQYYRDLFTTKRTSEKVFHSSYFVLTYQGGSCKQFALQEELS
jgi:hypothetical protein